MSGIKTYTRANNKAIQEITEKKKILKTKKKRKK